MANTASNKGLPRGLVAAVAHGWAIIPVDRNKRPRVPEWASFQSARPTLEQVERWYAELHPDAWAVITGAISGIIALDFDGAAGAETMHRYRILPHVRTGSGGAHEYVEHPGFRVPTLNGRSKLALQQLLPGTDIRGDGGIAVFYGRNMSGFYKWLRPLSEPDPWAGELIEELTRLFHDEGSKSVVREPAITVSAACDARVSTDEILNKFLARERNGAGRNDTGFELAVQLRDNRYNEEEAAAVMFQYAAAVKSTNTKGSFERYSQAEARATLHSVYSKQPRDPWGQKGNEGQAGNSSESADEWQTPEPLGGALPPVLPFDECLLPASLRPLTLDIAERMQVPIDLPAAAAVVCLAGAVNRRAVVQPKDGDPSWVVVANLWGAVVALSGYLKTPTLQVIIHLLDGIQTEWRRAYAEAMKEYAHAREEFDLRHTAWKEEFKAATKKGRILPARPADEPEKPKLRRLIVNDATFEALHQTMADNPAGILVVRDELTGWWAELDKTGREGERAFCLQAWNGDTGHTIDRIGRGTIHVPACCMSMIGGIQPSRLRSYLAEALKDGPGNDGLIQRFQVMVWPDAERAWRRINRPTNQSAQRQAERVFRSLVELDADQPARFFFDPDGQELFWQWLERLELKVRGDELHPALISHLSKYRSLMPSLALLFCLADLADQTSVGEFPQKASDGKLWIPLENVQQAAEMCKYLESHAKRVYSSIVTPQMCAAQELAQKIKQRKVGANGPFSCRRDVYLKGWTGLTSPEAVRQAAEILEAANWIRRVANQPNPAGGRPPDRYVVNPRVFQ
jgi:putative DNA primase/helicase